MGAAIGQSLPVAVGVLLSPMPIVAMVLMLVSARARSNGFAFLVGWFLGVLGAGAVIVLVVGAAGPERRASRRSGSASSSSCSAWRSWPWR